MKDEKSAPDTARAELASKHADEMAALKRRFDVLETLPPGELPIVCNSAEPGPTEPRAWVSYSAPSYDPENKFDPVQLLRAVEAKGWVMLPGMALVKWDNYRRAPEPCDNATAQTLKHPQGRKYTSGDDVAPYWVLPQQHTKPDFVCFMRGPDGLVYRVSVDVPAIGCHIHARRVCSVQEGNWHFAGGSARVLYPEHWQTHSPGTGAQVDTAQGISGQVYFPAAGALKTASEALAFLLRKEGNQ